ncbi:MAG TPA: oligosaccharide flippase family protein, partial [Verrucomicrobiae bacterium]|nr:oligosaccharide flippase family protein [Verrucomicrobiae bacterium]
IIVLASTTFRPTFEFSLEALGPHLAFSRDSGLLGLVGFVGKQIDPLVIGRVLGSASVGLYSVAWRIALLPMQFLSMPLQNALFTRLVMLRDDKKASSNLFLVTAWLIAAIIFPGFAVGAAASDAFFHVFLSEKWLPAAPVFVLLAPTLAFQAVMIVCGTMLLAMGESGRRLRLNVEIALAWVVVLPFVAGLGVDAVAAAYTLTYALISIRAYPMYLHPIGCTALELFRTLRWPILVAFGGAAVHVGVRTWAPTGPVVEVGVAIVVLLSAYGVLALIERRKMSERIGVLRSVMAMRAAHETPPTSEQAAT